MSNTRITGFKSKIGAMKDIIVIPGFGSMKNVVLGNVLYGYENTADLPLKKHGIAIGDGAQLSGFVTIGDGAVIGNGAKIGKNSDIKFGAEIGKFAKIGRDCVVNPCAVIGDETILGDGVVVGQDLSIASGLAFTDGARLFADEMVIISAVCKTPIAAYWDTDRNKFISIGQVTKSVKEWGVISSYTLWHRQYTSHYGPDEGFKQALAFSFKFLDRLGKRLPLIK